MPKKNKIDQINQDRGLELKQIDKQAEQNNKEVQSNGRIELEQQIRESEGTIQWERWDNFKTILRK